MELIDIIKSSVILFIFSLLMVLIISYTLYKIRNQAKTKNLGYFNRKVSNNLRSAVIPGKGAVGSPPTTELQIDTISSSDKRFMVVNRGKGEKQIDALRFRNQTNIYKFYEEFNSKIMFKIKPGVNTE